MRDLVPHPPPFSTAPPPTHLHTHTHTHQFNGPFSGTTRMSRYQKGKTDLDFTEATDSEWQWHQLGHMQVCTLLQTDNYASTPPLSFLQAGCPSCRPTTSEHWRHTNRLEGVLTPDLEQHTGWWKSEWITATTATATGTVRSRVQQTRTRDECMALFLQ